MCNVLENLIIKSFSRLKHVQNFDEGEIEFATFRFDNHVQFIRL